MQKVFLRVVLVMYFIASSMNVSFAATGDALLKPGARGYDVQMVQKLLTETGFFFGAIDGVFGGGTLTAVQAFQRANGLAPDGVVGPETFECLKRSNATPSRYSRTFTMRATAYTSQDYGNSGYTYRGNPLHKGLVAVDPAVIPLGYSAVHRRLWLCCSR